MSDAQTDPAAGRALAMRYPSFVDGLPLTRRALDFAVEHHRDQRRDADLAPFILHPLEVGQLLRGGGSPDAVVAAGVLHDVIEDADVGEEELRRRFGEQVARIVDSVTEPDRAGSYAYRKARLRIRVSSAGRDALVVYAADKVAKSRELRMMLVREEPAPDELAEKLTHYWSSLALLELRLQGHPLVAQLRFELEALELLPPARSL